MPITREMLEEIMKDYSKPEDLLGEKGLLNQLTKALVEKALGAELTDHLGYEKYEGKGRKTGNSRNGSSKKKVIGKQGEMEIEVPRDRNAEFEPQIIKKNQKRFDGFDDKVISMYSRGMTTREIQAHLEEIYGVEVSPAFISEVTNAVVEEVRTWQSRPLDEVYPIVYLDAIRVKVRSDGKVINKAIYLALALNLEGHKEVLGMWASENEGARFWLSVMTELKNRGVKDIFLACVDGLKGFPEAIEAVFPKAQIQLCVIHTIRNALAYVSYKDLKAIVADMKLIYQAVTEVDAEIALELFADKWLARYPMAVQVWKTNWKHLRTFFAFPIEIRKAIYTTNAIESVNFSLRKISKNRALFPNDEAVFKLFYLAIKNVSKKWTMPIRCCLTPLTNSLFSLIIVFLCPFNFIYTNYLTTPSMRKFILMIIFLPEKLVLD
jgi:putative transposase